MTSLVIELMKTRRNFIITTNISVPPQLFLHGLNTGIIDHLPLKIQDQLEVLEFLQLFLSILPLLIHCCLPLGHISIICICKIITKVVEGVAFINLVSGTL